MANPVHPFTISWSSVDFLLIRLTMPKAFFWIDVPLGSLPNLPPEIRPHQGDGFKYVLFSPRSLGKMNPFWQAYLSTGCLNHQLVYDQAFWKPLVSQFPLISPAKKTPYFSGTQGGGGIGWPALKVPVMLFCPKNTQKGSIVYVTFFCVFFQGER